LCAGIHERNDGSEGARKARAARKVDLMMDPYMVKTEGMLRDGKIVLERRSVAMRASAPAFSAVARRRKLMNAEARYADVCRRFEQLRTARMEHIAEVKIGLEKAWEAFRSELGWK
jgi:hypothetical protein